MRKDRITRQNILFKAIAICLPFTFLVLFEIILRLFNFGYNTDLFINDEIQKVFLSNNIHIGRLFFNDQEIAPNGYSQSFLKEKPSHTFRIFVLGESSAQGFPYNQRGSFPRMLQYMFDKTCKETKVEIINLALTAINSYTLLSFTDEIVKMSPDAILIYTGHNEYYGALGVGSQQRLGNNRELVKLTISLKKFKTVQLSFQLYGKIKGVVQSEKLSDRAGLMCKMAGEQEIIYDSELFQNGLEQYKKNMAELLQKFQKHNIPVYISNLVSNEKGQKPFISKLKTDTDSIQYHQLHQSGIQSYQNHDFDAALKNFMLAEKMDSSYALNNYMLGEIQFNNGNYEKAKQYYKKAKELDALRFRAPDAINTITESFGNQFNNVHFVDVKRLFVQQSLHGILGNELFTDHLHPNLSGYFLIAEAFYNAIKDSRIIESCDSIVPMNTFRKEMPVTVVDSMCGELLISYMKEKWPFFEKHKDIEEPKLLPEILAVDFFHKQISWETAMDSLFKYYLKNDNIVEAIRVAKAYELDHPNESLITSEIARLYSKLGDYNEAVFYFKKAFEKNRSIEIAQKLVVCLLQSDKPEEATNYLKFLIERQPENRMAIALLKQTEDVITFKKLELTDPENNQVIFGLANFYLYIKNRTEAKRYMDKAVAKYPTDKMTLQLLIDYQKSSFNNQTP